MPFRTSWCVPQGEADECLTGVSQHGIIIATLTGPALYDKQTNSRILVYATLRNMYTQLHNISMCILERSAWRATV